MKEQELQDYIKSTYPRENEQCDWKEASNLKHFVKGHEGEDIVSYVSAFANMEGAIWYWESQIKISRLGAFKIKQPSPLKILSRNSSNTVLISLA